MIISVDELRQFVKTDEADPILQAKLEGLESFIKKYTNNKFVNRETFQTDYPPDIKSGLINLMKWELENRDKVGVASETISRHSVTYFDQSATNTDGGFPIALLGFLKPYVRARF